MRIILTIEAQNTQETGLDVVFREINACLSFVTAWDSQLEEQNNYGTEFRSVSIIPTCVDDHVWTVLGWKERKQVWRKKKTADIRLRMDYSRFIRETPEIKRLLFIDIIVRSVKILKSKSKGEFEAEKLIADILAAVNVTQEQLDRL